MPGHRPPHSDDLLRVLLAFAIPSFVFSEPLRTGLGLHQDAVRGVVQRVAVTLAEDGGVRILRVAAFQNPEFYRAQAMRLNTFGKPRIISCAEDHPNHVALPRGCAEKVVRLLKDLGVARFFIQVIGIRGKSTQKEQATLQLSPEEWLATVPEVASKAAQQGIHVIYPKVFLEKDETFECAGKVAENFFIFPNGRVYCCPLCEDFPINTFRIEDNCLTRVEGLTEEKLFTLDIPEGCVMNKLLQPGNIEYDSQGNVVHRISCCLLKQELKP